MTIGYNPYRRGVRPMPVGRGGGATIPPNLLTNGTFDSANGWTLTNASIGNGVLTWAVPATGTGVASHALDQAVPAGATVRVTLTRASASGAMSFTVAGTASASVAASNGTQSVDIANVAGGSDFAARIVGSRGSPADNSTLDNVTVQVV